MDKFVKETMQEYLRHPAVSASRIKEVLRSPAHYQASLAAEPDSNETPAKRMGTLIHSAVLEPRRFLDNFMIAPDVDRRTKDGKAQWEEFQVALAVKEGSIGLKQSEADVVVGVAKSMLAHPLAANLL